MDAILLHRRTAEKGLKKIFKLISNIKQSIFNRKLDESEICLEIPIFEEKKYPLLLLGQFVDLVTKIV